MVDIIKKNFSAELVRWFELSFPKYTEAMKNTSHHYDQANLNPYHIEGSVWTHTLMALSVAEIMEMPPNIKLAILLHDLGKPYARTEVDESKKVSFKNHAAYSFFRAGEVLTKFAKDTGITEEDFVESKKFILFLIANHGLLFDHELDILNEKYTNKMKYFLDYTPHLLPVSLCDSKGRLNVSPKGNNLDVELYNELLAKTPELPKFNKTDRILVGIPKLTIMMGLPCAGKSTLIKNVKSFNSIYTHILSRDKLVMEMAGTSNYDLAWKLKGTDPEVDKELERRFVRIVQAKQDIVLDMTNLSKKKRNKWLNLALGYKKEAILVYTDLNVIYARMIERSAQDKKTIPNHVMDSMMGAFTFPFYDQFDEIEWIFTK